jgi:hypothetical protein
LTFANVYVMSASDYSVDVLQFASLKSAKSSVLEKDVKKVRNRLDMDPQKV